MRNIVVILIVLFIGLNCFSQTKQPVKQKLNYMGSLIYLDENSDFHQNSFVLSWHWYSGYKMSSALSVNQIHVNSEVPNGLGGLRYLNPNIERIAHNANMTLITPWISSNHWVGYPVAYNIAFQYEPTYKVDLSKPAESFVPRQYDTTRYAFGFGTVRGFIDNTYGNENYDRLQLFNNDSIRNQIVLADPWVCNDLATIIQCNTTLPHGITYDTVVNIYNKPNGTPLTRVDSLAGGDDLWQDNPNKRSHKDRDARWTEKNGEKYFGYKNHAKVDTKSKFINDYVVTDASVHDSQALEDLLDESDSGQELHADSAYTGEKQEKIIAKYNMKNQVNDKGYRNKPLTAEQKENNRQKSKTRARVEHVFGFMEQSMNGLIVRSVGISRATGIIGLINLTYNIFRYEQVLRLA